MNMEAKLNFQQNVSAENIRSRKKQKGFIRNYLLIGSLIVFLASKCYSQTTPLLSTSFSYTQYNKNGVSFDYFDFRKIDIAGGIRYKKSIDILLASSYFENQRLYSSSQTRTKNLMLSLNLRYWLLKNGFLSMGAQLDCGGVIYSNLKNEITHNRLELLTNSPPILPWYNNNPVSRFKNWRPIVTPKIVFQFDLKYVDFIVGFEYTFLSYRVEDLGLQNTPSSPAKYRSVTTSGFGYSGSLVYRFKERELKKKTSP
jgi:hypothetical protein